MALILDSAELEAALGPGSGVVSLFQRLGAISAVQSVKHQGHSLERPSVSSGLGR